MIELGGMWKEAEMDYFKSKQPRFDSRQEKGRNYFSATASRPAQSPIQWEALFPGSGGGGSSRGLNLTTHLHLLPPLSFHGVVLHR
jgi:hypothetical protein